MTVLTRLGILVIVALVLAAGLNAVRRQQSSPPPSNIPQTATAERNGDPVEAPIPQRQAAGTDKKRKPGKNSGRVIVYLKGRQHTVTVYTGQRFGIASNDGKVLAESLSLQEFQARFPQTYQFYRWSYAEAWAGTDLSVR